MRFMRPIVTDKSAQLGDPRLNYSQEITPQTVIGGIFDSFFFAITSVDNDVISGVAVE